MNFIFNVFVLFIFLFWIKKYFIFKLFLLLKVLSNIILVLSHNNFRLPLKMSLYKMFIKF